jgi:hypothetical protein
MNRRSFLASMLAACAAPAIVRADSLMRIVPREILVVRPVIPTGMIFEYLGDSIPVGYVACDGRVLAQTDYPELYGVIGTAYGDGGYMARLIDSLYTAKAFDAIRDTFAVPDLRGRIVHTTNFMIGPAADGLALPQYIIKT